MTLIVPLSLSLSWVAETMVPLTGFLAAFFCAFFWALSAAFALAAADNESHIKALAQLAALLGDEKAMIAIRAATSVDAVLASVSSAAAEQAGVQS